MSVAEEQTVRLSIQSPYDWSAALEFLARRAVDGVEQVEAEVYRRAIRCDGQAGTLEIVHNPAPSELVVTIRSLPAIAVQTAAARVRRMFDLDADLQTIGTHLARDPTMAPLVAARPALRVLRGWDGFEVATRTVIGQQVTVARARQLNGILVERCGSSLGDAAANGLRRLFPTPRELLDADLSSMGMPGARVAALRNVAAAALNAPRLFEATRSVEETVARLRAIPGIGDWTAHYIAMRACGEPDAFPASDVGLLRGAADAGRRPTPADLLARAEAWRPWRAYAAHQLWAADTGPAHGPQNDRFKSKRRSVARLQKRHSE